MLREKPAPEGLRGLLKGILGFGIVGMAIELLLLGHTEGLPQLIPLALLAVGFVTLVATVRRSGTALKVFLGTMVFFVLSGGLGVYLHYIGNAEFELEMSASSSGWALFSEAMTGATPALAPGTMALLGLVGLAVGYRHPLLRNDPASANENRGES